MTGAPALQSFHPSQSQYVSPSPTPQSNMSLTGMFNSLFRHQPKQCEGPVAYMGAIAAMAFPRAWVEGETVKQGFAVAREYHPLVVDDEGNIRDKTDVQINLTYRGTRTSEVASKAFRDLLRRGPRKLDPQPFQQYPLNEVLRQRGQKEMFEITSAEVEDINGMPALVIEGSYTSHNVRARVVYADAHYRSLDRTCEAPVQEVAYVAVREEFANYYNTAMKVLKSISWRL